MILEIILFVLRTSFTVFIYVFIGVVLFYLIKDLHYTAKLPITNPAFTPDTGERLSGSEVTDLNTPGLLRVESAPPEYALDGVEYVLDRELKLGRGMQNEIILPDRFASNSHARLFNRDGQYWLEDLGSRNGTYLNGKPLAETTVIANGDQIRIGEIIFKFVRWGYEVESDHRMRSGAPAE